MAMTAHVVYRALDPRRPATISPSVIAEIIRGAIGFQGLLFSDDLSMNALEGGLGERTAAALASGCDIARSTKPCPSCNRYPECPIAS